MNFSRRNFLQVMGIAGGVVALREFAGRVPMAHADPGASPGLFLLCYMRGGWDQLLALDPRDNTDPRFSEANARKTGGSGIMPAYGMVTEAATKTLLASNPSGVQRAGNLSFGPAVPTTLMDHAADLAILRGVSMETLTHEVGRRYFTTGKFPRGLAASGSSITTLVANAGGPTPLLPNLAVSTESYNEGLPSFASPTSVNSTADLQLVLKPLGKALDPKSADAIEAFQAKSDTCENHELDQNNVVTTFRELTKKSHSVAKSNAASLFQFSLTSPPAEVKTLFDALGISTAADLAGPRGRAAIAAQALAKGISQAVSVELADDLDDHDSWDTDHAPKIRTAMDALGRLITVLKNTPHKDGGSVWSKTTLLLFSDFARTPLVNTRNGRDHHLASSALVAGPKIRGNQVVGATADQLMGAQLINPGTGKVDAGGVKMRPADIHATLLTSMGIAIDPIRNQNPTVISALLK